MERLVPDMALAEAEPETEAPESPPPRTPSMRMKSAMSQKLARMTTAPVEGLILRLALPTIAIMLISAMYNLADTYFVGTIGTTATAAVGVSFSLMAVIQAFGFFFGQGAGNYISRQLGAGDLDNAGRMAAAGFVGAFACGLAITVLGLVFIRPFALALGSTPTILPHAIEYLRFILVAAPFMCASLTLNGLLRFQGSAFYAMIGMTSGAILNVILDPIFIFGLDLGVAGASLATCISQVVGFVLLLAGCSRQGNIAISLRHFHPLLKDAREIVRGGFPSLCRQGLAALAVLVLNRMAAPFGDAAIAAMSIVQRVSWFAGSALIGWGQGFQPVCGFNYGAGCFERVRRSFWFCVKSSFFLLLALSIIGIIFAPDIIRCFRPDDPDVIRIGTLALRCQCLLLPTTSWVVLNNMMLQTLGLAGKATLLALSRQGLFLLPILFLLTPRLGILGIQIAQPTADFFTLLLALPLGVGTLNHLAKGKKEGEAVVLPTDE